MDEMRREVLRQLGLLLAVIPTACTVEAGVPGLLAETAAVPPSTSGFTRWRTGPLPRIIKTPGELVAAKLVLPFDRSVARGRDAYPTYTYKPFAWSEVGLTPDMGSAGERQEIGLVTHAIAAWLTGGSANNMLVQAEAHGTSPVHYRQKNGVPSLDGTGSMVDINDPKCRYASSYDNRDAVKANPWFNMAGAKVRTDIAHYPNLCYVPYLATGDLYYLQEIQDAATYAVIWGNPEYRNFERGWLDIGQVRGYAWALNLVASAYLATPEVTPPGMLSKSYWKTILDNNRARFKAQWVDSTSPIHKLGFITNEYVTVSDGSHATAPWQQDMLSFVIGWMIYTGQFPEWRENYEWSMRGSLMRANGTDGFPRSGAAGYWWNTGNVTSGASLAAANGIKATADGNAPSDVDGGYLAYLRGTLKLASMNGVNGAAQALPYIDSQTKRKNILYLKWAV